MRTSRRRMLQVAGAGVVAAPLGAAPCEASGLLDVFAKRRTVRRYKPDPVPEEHLRQILDAARRVPTCMNQQPWMFLVVRDKAKIEAMRQATLGRVTKYFDGLAAQSPEKKDEIDKQKAVSVRFTEGYFTAPVYVVVLVDKEAPCGYAIANDGPMAVSYLMLAARVFGYGTAYLTDGIPESVVTEVLKIPERYHRICITPIGVPDKWPEEPEKRKLEEMVAYETLEGHPALRRIPYHPF